jgi:hypothetical protein
VVFHLLTANPPRQTERQQRMTSTHNFHVKPGDRAGHKLWTLPNRGPYVSVDLASATFYLDADVVDVLEDFVLEAAAALTELRAALQPPSESLFDEGEMAAYANDQAGLLRAEQDSARWESETA